MVCKLKDVADGTEDNYKTTFEEYISMNAIPNIDKAAGLDYVRISEFKTVGYYRSYMRRNGSEKRIAPCEADNKGRKFCVYRIFTIGEVQKNAGIQ